MANALDRFNRADTDDTANSNAGTLGNADSGQAWSIPYAAWRWKIVGNQAGRPNGPVGQSIVWLDTGESDVLVEATLAGSGGGYIGIVSRVIDDNNYLLIQCLIGSSAVPYTKMGGGFNNIGGGPPGAA